MEYRNECVDVLSNNFGIICDAHHHEVATAGQCEIDIRYDTLVNSADSVQSYKYIVKNVAKKHDMIATMMPKPIALDNGSGMHVNVSYGKIARISSLMKMINMQKYQGWQGILVVEC